MHPEIRGRYKFILNNLKRKFFRKKNKKHVIKPQPHIIAVKTAGLVVIGVSKNKMKQGIGSLLQVEFEKRARALGAEQMQLSVKKTNEAAIASYTRNGWKVEAELGSSYLMKKQL